MNNDISGDDMLSAGSRMRNKANKMFVIEENGIARAARGAWEDVVGLVLQGVGLSIAIAGLTMSAVVMKEPVLIIGWSMLLAANLIGIFKVGRR